MALALKWAIESAESPGRIRTPAGMKAWVLVLGGNQLNPSEATVYASVGNRPCTQRPMLQ